MKFLETNSSTKVLESDVKNKWRWEWLAKVDEGRMKFGEWLKNRTSLGCVLCVPFGRTISYKSSGKKAVKAHVIDKAHTRNVQTVKSNQVLPGSSKAEHKKVERMQDRIARQRILTTCFLSEHCLPFSLAGDLLDLAKRLAEDKLSLEKTTLSSTSATYVTTHGVAKSFKEEVQLKVKGKFVSLNIDKATNKNNDKVLNILVQYYDDDKQQVMIHHSGSRIQNVATAIEILKSIESVLQEYNIEWTQIVSVLKDNCSTMRGIRGGVETLIREKNKCLLDISGDIFLFPFC